MIESHIYEWVNLLVRWIHFIVGVAWIGASFYFNWLENNLNRNSPQEPGITGNLWAVHGGGFYHLKKFKTGPEQLPTHLHWFKWEAYTTWLSGMTLLVIVYYFNARLYLIDPSVRDLTSGGAVIVSLVSILGSWFVYDVLCRTALKNHKRLLATTLILYFTLLAWFLCDVFSGRAAYIHVGASIGTMMVGNVFFVIIPAQRKMVSALEQGRKLDTAMGEKGLLRSTHNNYLTLPVLFIMISNHFPSTYGHEWNWLVLIMVSLASIVARHYFNIRVVMKSLWWLLPISFAMMVGVMWFTAPNPVKTSDVFNNQDAIVSVMSVVSQRCTVCHSETPTQSGFSSPPMGLVLDSIEQLEINAVKVYGAAVLTKTMPVGNLSGMTDEERNLLAGWYENFAKGEN